MRGTVHLQDMQKWFRIGAIIITVLMIRVWENVHARRLERQVGQMRQERDRLTYDNGRLQTQIHQYTAPSRLEAAAKERGMIPLDPSRRIGVHP